MPLQVLRAVPATGKSLFRFSEDHCSGRFCALIMSRNVVDQNEHALDHPRDALPFSGANAMLPMGARSLIVRRWAGEHDQSVARLQFSVG